MMKFPALKRFPPSAPVPPFGTTVGCLTFYNMPLAAQRTHLPDDGVRVGLGRHVIPARGWALAGIYAF